MSTPARSSAAIGFLLLSGVTLACSASAPAAGTPLVSPSPTAVPSTPSATLEPTTSPGAVTTGDPVATGIQNGEYLTADELLICMPFDRSRFAEYDASGNAIGVDVEIAQEIAAQLGRQPELMETLFDDLLGAIESRTCDVTVGGQFITQGRLELIDMIPYRQGTPHVIVQKGNALGINELLDLCGRTFAVVGGTVYVDMVLGVGDYEGVGLDDQCVDSGATAIDLRQFDSQAVAEQSLAEGDVDAYAGNDFVTIDQPDVYERSVELPLVRNGIGHFLGADSLDSDVRAALRAMIDDGTYLDILERYGVPDVALTVRP